MQVISDCIFTVYTENAYSSKNYNGCPLRATDAAVRTTGKCDEHGGEGALVSAYIADELAGNCGSFDPPNRAVLEIDIGFGAGTGIAGKVSGKTSPEDLRATGKA